MQNIKNSMNTQNILNQNDGHGHSMVFQNCNTKVSKNSKRIINIIDRKSPVYLNEFNLKWDRRLLYGYNGEENGFYKWLDTKLKKFESSNKQGSISLKDSSKVSQGTGHTALLSKQKGSDILQDKTMCFSCK